MTEDLTKRFIDQGSISLAPERIAKLALEHAEGGFDVGIQSVHEQQIKILTAYRKSLIHECVTGQRRIAQAELMYIEAYA